MRPEMILPIHLSLLRNFTRDHSLVVLQEEKWVTIYCLGTMIVYTRLCANPSRRFSDISQDKQNLPAALGKSNKSHLDSSPGNQDKHYLALYNKSEKRFQSNQSTQNVSFFQFISLIFYFLFWQVGLIKSWYQVSLAASSFSSHCINTATTRITEKGLIVMIMSQDLNCLLSLLPPLQKVIWMPVSIWVCNISESVLVWHVCVSCVILQ